MTVHPSLVGYEIEFSRAALKSLHKLEKQISKKIIQKIKEMCLSAEHLNIKKLKDSDSLYRLRVGVFRVIYTIEHGRITIHILSVGHRKGVYKKNPKLERSI